MWRRAFPALIAFGLVALTGATAQAYNTYSGHRLKYGVYNQYFWLDSQAEYWHPTAIRAGVGHWNATTDTTVWYVNTGDRSKSRLDFYRRDDPDVRYCATTQMYVGTDQVEPRQSDWVWAKVIMHSNLLKDWYCGPDTHRDGIVAHEQGHAMGLDHNGNASSLMYSDVANTRVDVPIGDDRNGINYLY
ncbi:matrixin family metalloprotease [Streptomyces sp. NPDC020807]|uniref:matrixin family metalloprotease n=1 Tax=Streptomyces sp. NPDC020807 TaxID=3155119 RepID=UPI0033F50322